MPITNPFILTVNAGRKLATQPDIAKGKSDCIGRNFEVLIYYKHVNTLDGPNY